MSSEIIPGVDTMALAAKAWHGYGTVIGRNMTYAEALTTAGLDWTTVHYKGGAPAMQDLLAGRAHVMFANISDVIQQVKGGKLDASAFVTPAGKAGVVGLQIEAHSSKGPVHVRHWE